jgi:hypothetical protein
MLANGLQTQPADQLRRKMIGIALGHVSLQPSRKRRDGGLGMGNGVRHILSALTYRLFNLQFAICILQFAIN